jgi:hypothetical protein
MLNVEGAARAEARAPRRGWHAAVTLLVIGMVACDGSSSDPTGPPAPGSILVMTETAGFLKAESYELLVDAVSKGAVDANGQVTISELEPGSYEVALGEVPDNCTAEALTVTVESDETTGVTLSVVCTYADPVTYTIRFSRERPDLDTGEIIECPFGICSSPDYWDLYAHRNSQTEPESEIRQNQTNEVEIAHLPGVTLEGLTEDDFLGATFTTELVAEPFDAGRVILIRTDLGNVFALGNPVEDLISSPAVLTFDAALIAEPGDPEGP